MTARIRQYARRLTIFGLLVFAIYMLFTLLAPGRLIPFLYLYIVPFFYVVVMISRLILEKYMDKGGNRFSNSFIIITVARFIFYVGVLMTYSFVFPDNAVAFIITFFMVYFAFTLYEVFYLYSEINNKVIR